MDPNSYQSFNFLRPAPEQVGVSHLLKFINTAIYLKRLVLSPGTKNATTVLQVVQALVSEVDIDERIRYLNRLSNAKELKEESEFLKIVKAILKEEVKLVAALPLSTALKVGADGKPPDLKRAVATFERDHKVFFIDIGSDVDIVIENAHAVFRYGKSERNDELPEFLVLREDESYKAFCARVGSYYSQLEAQYKNVKNDNILVLVREIYAVGKMLEKLKSLSKVSDQINNKDKSSAIETQLTGHFDLDGVINGQSNLDSRIVELYGFIQNPSLLAADVKSLEFVDPVNLKLRKSDQIGYFELDSIASYWQNLGENFEYFSDDLEVILESLAMNGRRYSPAQIIDAQANLNLLQGHISESVVKNIEYELESLEKQKKTLEAQSESKKGSEKAPHAQKIADAQSRIVLIDGFLQAARFVKGVIVSALAKVDSILESEDDSNLSPEEKSLREAFGDDWQNEYGFVELGEEDFEDDQIKDGVEAGEVEESTEIATAKDDLVTRRKRRRGIPREFYGSIPKPSVLKLPIVIKDRRNNIEQQRMNVLGVESPEYSNFRRQMGKVFALTGIEESSEYIELRKQMKEELGLNSDDPKLINLALQLYLKRFNRNERNLSAEVTGSLVRMKAINGRLIKGVLCKEIARFARPKPGTPINDLFEDVYGQAEITGNDLPRRGYPDLFAMSLVELDHAQNPLYRDRPSVKKRILTKVENTLAKSNFNNLSNTALSDQEKQFYVVFRGSNQDQRNELTSEQQKTYQDIEDKLRKAIINNLSPGEKEYLEFLETASDNQTLQVLRNISYVFGLLEGGDKARNQISKALFDSLIAVVESKENLKDDDIDILYSPNLNIPQIVDLIAKYGLNEKDIELIDKYLARDAMFIAPAYDKQKSLYTNTRQEMNPATGKFEEVRGLRATRYTTRLAVIPRIGDAGILPVEFEVDNEFKLDSTGNVTASIPRIPKQPKTFFIEVPDLDIGFDSERYYLLKVHTPSKSGGSVGVRNNVTEKSQEAEESQKVTSPMGRTVYSREQNPKISSPKNDLEDQPSRHTKQQQVDTERRQSGGHNVLIIDEDDNRSAAQIIEDLRNKAEPVPDRKKRERKTPRQQAEQGSADPMSHQDRLNALKLNTATGQSPTPHPQSTLAQFVVESLPKVQAAISNDQPEPAQDSNEQISDQGSFDENLKYFIDTFSTEEEVIKLISIIDKLNIDDNTEKESVKRKLQENIVNSDQSKAVVDVFYDTLQAFIYILESYKKYPQSRDVDFALFEGIFNRLSDNVLELINLSQMDPGLLSQFDGVWLDFYDVLEHIEAIPVQESVSEVVVESSAQANRPDSLTLDNPTTIVPEADSQSTSLAHPKPTNSSDQSYAQDSGLVALDQSISVSDRDAASQSEVQPGLKGTPEIIRGPEKSIQEIQEIRSKIAKRLILRFKRAQAKDLAEKLELKAANTSKWFEIGVDTENLAKLEAFYTSSILPFLSDVNSPLRLRDLYVITNSGGYGVYDSSQGKSVPAFYKIFNGKPNKDERLYKLLEASKDFSELFTRETSGRLADDFGEQKQKFYELLLSFEGGFSFSDFLKLLQIGAVCTFVNLMTCSVSDLASILNNEPSEANFYLESDTQTNTEATLEENDKSIDDQITTNSSEAVPTLTEKERGSLDSDIEILSGRIAKGIKDFINAENSESKKAIINSMPHGVANIISSLKQNPSDWTIKYLFMTALVDSIRKIDDHYTQSTRSYIHRTILSNINPEIQNVFFGLYNHFPFGIRPDKITSANVFKQAENRPKLDYLVKNAQELVSEITRALQSLNTPEVDNIASQAKDTSKVDSIDLATYKVPESDIVKLDYSDPKVRLSLEEMRQKLVLARNSLSRVREYTKEEIDENNSNIIFRSTYVLTRYIDLFRVSELATDLGQAVGIVHNFLNILTNLSLKNSEISELNEYITNNEIPRSELNEANRRFKDRVYIVFGILEQILEYHEAKVKQASGETKVAKEASLEAKISDYRIPEFSLEQFPPNLTNLVAVTDAIDRFTGLDRFLQTTTELDIDQVLKITSEIEEFKEILEKADSAFDHKFQNQIAAFGNYHRLENIAPTASEKTQYIEFLKDCTKLLTAYFQKKANFMTSAEYVGSLDLDIKKVEGFYLGRAKIWREGIQSYQRLLNEARTREIDVRQFVIDRGTAIHERIEEDLNSGIKSSLDKFLDAYRAVYSTNTPRFIKRYEAQAVLFEKHMKGVRNIDQALRLQESKDSIEPLIKASVSTAAINAEFFTSVLSDIRPKIHSQNKSQRESFLSPEEPNPVPDSFPVLKQIYDDLRREINKAYDYLDRQNPEKGIGDKEIDPELEEKFSGKMGSQINEPTAKIRIFRYWFVLDEQMNRLKDLAINLRDSSELKTTGIKAQLFTGDKQSLASKLSYKLKPNSDFERKLVRSFGLNCEEFSRSYSPTDLDFCIRYQKACIEFAGEKTLKTLHEYFKDSANREVKN